MGGFERVEAASGGDQATGNYPGKARTAEELRRDVEQVLRLLPGKHRFNLHAMYAETGGRPVARNAIGPEHFAGWIAWAKELGLGMDFNPSCFAHPMADTGFTLSSADPGIRDFWIEHCIACRTIGAAIGRRSAACDECVDPGRVQGHSVDRNAPRERLRVALDRVFAES